MKKLLQMDKNINKNSRGNLLIIAGSDMYPGAATLSALGALRTGAGLVFVATTRFAASSLNVALSEAIPLLCEAKDGAISFKSLTQKLEFIVPKINAIVLGPGLSRTAEAQKILQFVATEFPHLPKVFDADVLYYLTRWKPSEENGKDIIITPHLGEAGRILGKDVILTKLTAANLIKATNCHVLLKGHGTLLAIRDGQKILTTKINSGSPSLAVAGSGDVLAGAIGALLARANKRNLPPLDTFYDAAYLAATAHAQAGISLEEKFGVNGNLASEIANELPRFLNV